MRVTRLLCVSFFTIILNTETYASSAGASAADGPLPIADLTEFKTAASGTLERLKNVQSFEEKVAVSSELAALYAGEKARLVGVISDSFDVNNQALAYQYLGQLFCLPLPGQGEDFNSARVAYTNALLRTTDLKTIEELNAALIQMDLKGQGTLTGVPDYISARTRLANLLADLRCGLESRVSSAYALANLYKDGKGMAEPNLDEAFRYYGMVAGTKGAALEMKGKALYWMGHINATKGDFEEARKCFEFAVQIPATKMIAGLKLLEMNAAGHGLQVEPAGDPGAGAASSAAAGKEPAQPVDPAAAEEMAKKRAMAMALLLNMRNQALAAQPAEPAGDPGAGSASAAAGKEPAQPVSPETAEEMAKKRAQALQLLLALGAKVTAQPAASVSGPDVGSAASAATAIPVDEFEPATVEAPEVVADDGAKATAAPDPADE